MPPQTLAAKTPLPSQTPVPPSEKLVARLNSTWLRQPSMAGSPGTFNDAFEEKLARFVGVKPAMTVNSGSSANLVALSTLTSLLGDRALCPGDEGDKLVAAGFSHHGEPILQCGAIPVFVGRSTRDVQRDPERIEAAISPKPRPSCWPIPLGNPYNLSVITALCKQHGLWLIEGLLRCFGSTYQGQKVGTFGDMATLSFYPRPSHHHG